MPGSGIAIQPRILSLRISRRYFGGLLEWDHWPGVTGGATIGWGWKGGHHWQQAISNKPPSSGHFHSIISNVQYCFLVRNVQEIFSTFKHVQRLTQYIWIFKIIQIYSYAFNLIPISTNSFTLIQTHSNSFIFIQDIWIHSIRIHRIIRVGGCAWAVVAGCRNWRKSPKNHSSDSQIALFPVPLQLWPSNRDFHFWKSAPSPWKSALPRPSSSTSRSEKKWLVTLIQTVD